MLSLPTQLGYYNLSGAAVRAIAVAGLAALMGPAGAATLATVAIAVAVLVAATVALGARRRRPRPAHGTVLPRLTP